MSDNSDHAGEGSPSPQPPDAPAPSTLSQAIRVGLSIALVGLCAYAATEITLTDAVYPSVFLLLLTQAFVVMIVLQALRRQSIRQRIIPVAIATFSVVYISFAAAGILMGGNAMTALLFCAVAIGTAAVMPWSYRPRLVTVAIAGVALLANVYALATVDQSETFVLINVALIGIALLASVFVAAQIQSYRERLVREHIELEHAKGLVREMDEQIERRVIERTSELEATNRELETFSYSISHDLREPLRTVSGFAQSLMEDYGDQLGPDALEQMRRLRAGTQRMGQLVDGLLELSRIGHSPLVREEVDLSEAARLAVDELVATGPAREIEVVIPDGIRAYGDPRQLQSLIDNLIHNAWKFTVGREPAVVEVGTEIIDGALAYFVRDNGVGFDMTEHDRLFAAFERAERSGAIEGLGIGLATVSRIANRHGGRVWAVGSPNDGATFYFTLGTAPERTEPA